MQKIGKKKRIQKKTLNAYAQCGAGCVAHCLCDNGKGDNYNVTSTNYKNLKNLIKT